MNDTNIRILRMTPVVEQSSLRGTVRMDTNSHKILISKL